MQLVNRGALQAEAFGYLGGSDKLVHVDLPSHAGERYEAPDLNPVIDYSC